MEESDAKDLDQPEISSETEVVDSFQAISACSTDPVKLFSVSQNDLIAVNTNFICITSGNSLTVCKNTIEDCKVFYFASSIKTLEISKISDIISFQIESQGFIIFDLESEKEVFDYSQSQDILIMKWSGWTIDKIGIFWSDENLEIWSKVQNSFSSIKFEIKGLMCFEFVSSNKVIFQSQDFKCKLMKISENSSIPLEGIKEDKLEKIVALDEDKIALAYIDGINIYSINFLSIVFTLGVKQIFQYDPRSDYLYLGNPGSLQVLIITKDNFISQKYQECAAYFTLMEACSDIVVRKKNDKPQAVARHGDDVFFYTFRSDHQAEEPLAEIKEEIPIVKPKKKSKKNMVEIKQEAKQINPKEIINPIIMNVNKSFEEMIKKVEKTVSPHTINSLVTKTIQSALDQKIEVGAQKTLVQNTVNQSLRYEFQTFLIPMIQQQINENFTKMSSLFQESLKQSSEANSRAAAKATSLDTHMKNAIDNITNTTVKLEKEYLIQMKKINESEIKLLESLESKRQDDIIINKTGDSRLENLKRDIDNKLRNHDFESALSTVLKEKNTSFLYSVLEVINPKIMCSSRLISEGLLKQLFYELIDNIEKDNDFKDIYMWLEELGRVMNVPQGEISKMIVKLFDYSERKPKIRELIKIFTMRLA
ncbi:hypothetical protein SteCoe_9973 [Stentor coeruleus]|uniref:Enhancer of mRNA-decapping protein 4 WD40 repeat region domain-containing protein n=1 Tax=Stentor coeruleus TaxID=5963 RepID=A0A1R2CGM8_9CILI|nr:hypothetical protein SteCoe_9973 [Stentor coeruleus]